MADDEPYELARKRMEKARARMNRSVADKIMGSPWPPDEVLADRAIPQIPRVPGLSRPPRREINFTITPDYRPFDPDTKAALYAVAPVPNRTRGQQWLLWCSLLALVVIAAWIIVRAGH